MWYNYCLHFTDEKAKSTEGLSNLPKVTQPVKEGWNLNPAVRLQRELLPERAPAERAPARRCRHREWRRSSE